MEPILSVRNLSISFTQYTSKTRRHRLHVIDDLSLSIEAGQVVAVVGASGSGKSLLAHGILGILPYNAFLEGSIRYGGEALDQARAARLRGKEIVLVPQGVTYLDPLMKVGAQIRKGRRGKPLLDRCRAVLARYGLGPEVEDAYPFALSGGMARRVLISTAVIESPRLIIADEPTPGLDAQAAGRIMGHFRELADDGAGVLLITHDLELALTVADRVAVLYAGQTVEDAPACAFAAGRLLHPYTKALYQALPQNGFIPIPGTQPYPGEIAQGCLFAPRCGRCRAQCKEASIPYRAVSSGYVRCLTAEEEETA